jgi:hypothetical protein
VASLPAALGAEYLDTMYLDAKIHPGGGAEVEVSSTPVPA